MDKEFSRTGKDKTRALGLDLPPPYDHLVGRGVVLRLVPGAELVGARALLAVFPELEVPHDPREGAVGHLMALFFEDLPDPDGIALDSGEGLTDIRRDIPVPGLPLRPRYSPDHLLDGVP